MKKEAKETPTYNYKKVMRTTSKAQKITLFSKLSTEIAEEN